MYFHPVTGVPLTVEGDAFVNERGQRLHGLHHADTVRYASALLRACRESSRALREAFIIAHAVADGGLSGDEARMLETAAGLSRDLAAFLGQVEEKFVGKAGVRV